MLLRYAIGHVVRRVRRERAKTLQQLSGEARVSLPYISEIERGRKEVSSEILATLCAALDVPMDVFLREVSMVLARDAAATSIIELQSVREQRESSASRSTATRSTPSRSTEVLLAA
ncbi:MAG: family transcriptional regulator [Glaciihabitans sp.]|jgi:transcriptional regulator with XRE-family HTH domain|nr:family transcriptional regulator [Glaciihabitans sp.]